MGFVPIELLYGLVLSGEIDSVSGSMILPSITSDRLAQSLPEAEIRKLRRGSRTPVLSPLTSGSQTPKTPGSPGIRLELIPPNL